MNASKWEWAVLMPVNALVVLTVKRMAGKAIIAIVKLDPIVAVFNPANNEEPCNILHIPYLYF